MNQEEITQKKLALGCEKMLNNSAVSIDQQLKKMLASSNWIDEIQIRASMKNKTLVEISSDSKVIEWFFKLVKKRS